MRLIYLSPVQWTSFAQRPHKFVEWFHSRTDEPVLWVDPYPTRFPNWKDLRASRRDASNKHDITTPEWLTVLKPSSLPIEPIQGSSWINRQLWKHHFSQIDSFASEYKTLIAIGKPSALAVVLLERLSHCLSLYDAMDDFPAFYSGFSQSALARRENKIAEQVDVIWVSSSQLKLKWEHLRDDMHLVHNGLDLQALHSLKAMQKSSKKKIFGYVGTIATWFDWDWICSLAESRAKDEIRLIGPMFAPPIHTLPNNIKLLPACDHDSALKSMTEFDVGLIPFKRNMLTDSVDPIKYYEYRALGLPVLSTAFGEMRFCTEDEGLFLSHSIEDIPKIAEASLNFKQDFELARSFAQENSWEVRFDTAKLLAE